MSTRNHGEDVPVRRIDRILAFMSLGLLVLAIGCFLAIIIGTARGLWPAVGTTVYIAPIVAVGLLATVLIMTFVRRARANGGR